MTKKAKAGRKPPIKPPAIPQVVDAKTAIEPVVAASAVDPYQSVADRISALPTVSEHLTTERVQGVFAHLLLMSVNELRARERMPNISFLEQQVIRFLLKSMRELPNQEVPEKDDKGKVILDADGKPKMRFVGLHKDQLLNERQSFETMKYFHERAFGKPKIKIEHSGIPEQHGNHIDINMVLAAMDNLPRNVVEAISVPVTTNEGETKDGKA